MASPDGAMTDATLGPPVPAPRQCFGIGLNYKDHAAEAHADVALPPAPLTFTKFPSCIAAPNASIPLSGTAVDWEVEIVVVIGEHSTHVPVDGAWDVIAGLTLGQDVSDRAVQYTGTPPQFSLGKSFPNFGPIGPALRVDRRVPEPRRHRTVVRRVGERMQSARSSQLIFSIPTVVAYLSSITPLAPGDIIFTGTPAGVGAARTLPRRGRRGGVGRRRDRRVAQRVRRRPRAAGTVSLHRVLGFAPRWPILTHLLRITASSVCRATRSRDSRAAPAARRCASNQHRFAVCSTWSSGAATTANIEGIARRLAGPRPRPWKARR